MPFLEQHLEDEANLLHTGEPRFAGFTDRCARGDADAMMALSELFDDWSRKEGASAFYERAANFWRYRAFRNGNRRSAEYFKAYFADHPGERLASILPENTNDTERSFSFSIKGTLLNDLGFPFFDSGKDYEIKHCEGDKLVDAGTFESYEAPDEDGFGAEYIYRWWFLDLNMRRIPGSLSFCGPAAEYGYSKEFIKLRREAAALLKRR